MIEIEKTLNDDDDKPKEYCKSKIKLPALDWDDSKWYCLNTRCGKLIKKVKVNLIK